MMICCPKAKYSSIFNYPTLSWADIGAIGWLCRRSSDYEPGNADGEFLRNVFQSNGKNLQRRVFFTKTRL